MTPRQPYATVERVYTSETRQLVPRAYCEECDWGMSWAHGGPWLTMRAAARRHAARTGHAVWAGVRTDYRYAPRPPEKIGVL